MSIEWVVGAGQERKTSGTIGKGNLTSDPDRHFLRPALETGLGSRLGSFPPVNYRPTCLLPTLFSVDIYQSSSLVGTLKRGLFCKALHKICVGKFQRLNFFPL